MPLHYMITAKWGKDQADWYLPLEITVKNNTDKDVNSPAISFDVSKIVDIYLKAIANYGLTLIDFEGGFLGHTDALDRHIAAITEVIKAKPDIKISYTLPVDGAPGLIGFNGNGTTFLKIT